MQPFADLEQQLFRREGPGRVTLRSYGHIVPPENILPLALRTGAYPLLPSAALHCPPLRFTALRSAELLWMALACMRQALARMRQA